MKKIINWAKKIIEIIRKPEIGVLPGQMSFSLVLSAIPIITLIIYVSSLFAFSVDDILKLFSSFIPQNILSILSTYLSHNNFTIGVGITLFIAFILASNGPYSMIVASNMLYKIEKNDYLIGRIKALIMTLLLIFLVVFTLVFLSFGSIILNLLFKYGVFVQMKSWVLLSYYIIKWPISLFIIFMVIKILYTMAPDTAIKSKYVNKGAIFTTLSWIVIANVYAYYVEHFSRYDMIYGNLSTIIILMIVIYIFSYLFVIGIAINASIYENKNLEMKQNNNG